MPLQERNAGGKKDLPQTAPHLQVSAFSSGLGQISGLALGEDGAVFVLDSKSGRVLVLSDKERDGSVDLTRILANGLNNPVSMTRWAGELLVVDQDAIWRININTRAKSKLASLQNSDALPSLRPIIISPNGDEVILGLNQSDGSGKLIAIDRESGMARILVNADEPIRALSQVKGGPIWIGLTNTLVPFADGKVNMDASYQLAENHFVEGIYLPTSTDMTATSLSNLAGKFLVVTGQENQTRRDEVSGRNVIALDSSFGIPGGKPSAVVDGFITNHGRAAWGKPKALVWDERGLLLADAQNGVIWRISKREKLVKISKPEESEVAKFYADDDVKKPKTKWGSSIDTGSSLVSGSHIAKNWEDNRLIQSGTLMERLRKEENTFEDEDEDGSSDDVKR